MVSDNWWMENDVHDMHGWGRVIEVDGKMIEEE